MNSDAGDGDNKVDKTANCTPYPRALVINAFAIGSDSASGRVLMNILASWPRDELRQLNVGVGDASRTSSADTWHASGAFGRVAAAARRRSNKRALVGFKDAQIRGQSRWLKTAILAWLELVPIHIDSRLARWIDEFRPEVIYTWLGTPAMHRLVRQISVRWEIPTVVHIMDDWVSSKHAGNLLALPSRFALVKSFEREIRKAGECVAIGEKMASVYRARYGRRFDVISNGIDLSRFPPHPLTAAEIRARGRRLVVGHVGRLTGGRLAVLVAVHAALQRLSSRGIRSQLDLLGVVREQLPAELRESSLVSCDVDASDDRVRRMGTEVDATLQLESFSSVENEWIRLSLSAKLPLYLALGRPVIACGPADLGSIEYVAQNACGIVIAENCLTSIADTLERFVEGASKRAEMGRRARALAEDQHDRSTVCAHFAEVVRRAAWPAGARP